MRAGACKTGPPHSVNYAIPATACPARTAPTNELSFYGARGNSAVSSSRGSTARIFSHTRGESVAAECRFLESWLHVHGHGFANPAPLTTNFKVRAPLDSNWGDR